MPNYLSKNYSRSRVYFALYYSLLYYATLLKSLECSSIITLKHAIDRLSSWKSAYESSNIILGNKEIKHKVLREEDGLKLSNLLSINWLGSTKKSKDLAKNGYYIMLLIVHISNILL